MAEAITAGLSLLLAVTLVLISVSSTSAAPTLHRVARGADCQLPTNANTADGKKVCEERSPWHNTASIKKLGCTVTEVDKFRERRCEPEEKPKSTESPPSTPDQDNNQEPPGTDNNQEPPNIEEENGEKEEETKEREVWELPTSGEELNRLCGFHTSWDSSIGLRERGCKRVEVDKWRERKCDAHKRQQGAPPQITVSCGCPGSAAVSEESELRGRSRRSISSAERTRREYNEEECGKAHAAHDAARTSAAEYKNILLSLEDINRIKMKLDDRSDVLQALIDVNKVQPSYQKALDDVQTAQAKIDRYCRNPGRHGEEHLDEKGGYSVIRF